MKVGYVLHPYEESHASGMGYSMLEVCKQLAKREHSYEFVVYSSAPVLPGTIAGAYTNVVMPRGLVRQFFYFLRNRQVDALLFTAPLLPLWLPKRVKSIVLCKELGSQKVRPGRFADRLIAFVRDHILMPVCLRRASAIAASSEATRTDILHFYRVPAPKVQVVSEGYQEWSHFTGMPQRDFGAYVPFFFFAGKVKPRKNVHGIVTAFIEFKERTKSPAHLIIAGDYGGEYYKSMADELEAHALTPSVHFVGYATGEEMHWLYAHASAFVFPSINEGFGMPLIEAMSFGVPTLTSVNSPMAEIAEGASLLVDPLNIGSIAEGMERLMNDDNLRRTLVEKGKVQARLFSWERTGDGYAAIVDKTILPA